MHRVARKASREHDAVAGFRVRHLGGLRLYNWGGLHAVILAAAFNNKGCRVGGRTGTEAAQLANNQGDCDHMINGLPRNLNTPADAS